MSEALPEQRNAEESWQQERRTYIGSSEVFELLNQSQYGRGCARALGYRKLGAEPDFPIEEDDALFARGDLLEPIAATIYEQTTGRKVRRPPMDATGKHARVRRHGSYEWAAAATDRLILAGHGGVENVGDLEIKTRGEGPYYRVLRKGPYYGDMLQPQWSMFVTGHKWASLAILGVFGTLPLTWIDIKRDEDLIEGFQRVGMDFADEVWGRGEPPAPAFPASDQRCRVCVFRQTCRGEQIDQDELQELRTMKKSSRELVQIDDGNLARTLNDLELMRAEKKSLELSIDMAAEHAMMLLGNTNAALVRGFGRVYQMTTSTHYFDSQALRAELPNLYEKYMRPKVSTAYLRTYPNKENKNGKEE